MCDEVYGGCSRVVQATDCGSVHVGSIPANRPKLKEKTMETDYPGLTPTLLGALLAGVSKGL